MKIEQLKQEAVREFEKGMGEGTLFHTGLDYRNMSVQYAKVTEIKSFLLSQIRRAYEAGSALVRLSELKK